jgi:DNA-binding MarR family transcriptional regulator
VSHVTPSGTGRTGRPVAHRLDGTAIWLLNLASTRGHRLAQERLAHAHVRRWHYAILATLADTGPSAQADISRQLGVDRGDLVTFLNDLEERGWVSRTPDPTDRRRNSVSLTRSGRAALRRFDRLVVAADDELLAPLSATDRKQLLTLLERLVTGEDPSH